MRGPSNTDLPLLPQVLSGYISSVDLDATVAALAPRLVAYATGRTGCRSTGQDIAQEALAALVLRWRRFGPPESPEAFVFAVARRRAGRAIKRRALLKPLDFILAAQASDTGVGSYERRAELQMVIRTMKRLRGADREVLLLRIARPVTHNHSGPMGPRQVRGLVRTAAVDHQDFVGPGHRRQARLDIRGFVQRDYRDRQLRHEGTIQPLR